MKKQIYSILFFACFINFTFAQVPSYLPSAGLQAYYPFDGNANDATGNGNHGINFGATLTTDRTMTSSKAFQFAGNARIQIPDSVLKFNSRIISINAWVNYGNTATTMIVTRRKWSNASSEQFSFDTKAFNVKRNGGCAPAVGWATSNHGVLPSVGTWAMITVSYDGRFMKQYLNGVLRKTEDLGTNVLMDSCQGADIIIGGTWQSFPFYYTGKIDDISIYDRELSSTEITKIYNQCQTNQITNATNVTVTEGDSAIFTIQASLPGSTFIWQRRSGSNFVPLGNNSDYNGVTTNRLKVINPTLSMDSFQFRCIVSQSAACKDTSNIVRLFVKKKIIKNIPGWLPDSSLVAWYPFNGNAYDESGNGNNGIVLGSTSLTNDRKGNPNSAYTFNGTNSRISVPYSKSLQTKLVSINVWVRRINNNSTQLITKRNWANATGEQYSIDNSSLNVKRNSNCMPSVGWQTTAYKNGPALNVWNMVTMTYDGRFLKYYHNGVLNAERDLDSLRILDTCSGADLSFGAGWNNFPFWFAGQLDDISIYERALTNVEVMQIFTQCVKHIKLQPSNVQTSLGARVEFVTESNFDTAATYKWQINSGQGFSDITDTIKFKGISSKTLVIDTVHSNMNGNQLRCIIYTPYACNDTTAIVNLTFQAIIVKNIPNWLPDSSLVAWYPFNGNANDESGNGNNGVVLGAMLTNDRLNNVNSAYLFNGDSSRIRVPFSRSLNTSYVTINVWVRSSNNNTTRFLTKRNWVDGSGEQYSIDNNSLSIKRNSSCVAGAGWQTVNYKNAPTMNTWNMLTLKYDGVSLEYYLNGHLNAVKLMDTAGIMDTCLGADISFGAGWSNFPFWFTGRLDDISIYSRPLTQSEISQIFTRCIKHIKSHPLNAQKTEGEQAEFDAASNYDSIAIYQWQVNTGNGFVNINDTINYRGFKSAKLVIGSVNYGMHGNKYRCIISTPVTCNDTTTFANLFIQKFIVKNIPSWLPDSSLVAWYPFNGNAYDESGNGNNGIVIGSILSSDRIGNPNSAYTFNGNNARIRVPYSTSLKTPLVTINVWVKSANNNTAQYITKRNWTDASGEQYSIDNASLNIKSNSGCLPSVGWKTQNYKNAPTANNWAMVTLSYDGKNLRYYYNGVLNATKELDSVFRIMDTCNGADLSFGAGWSSFPFWFNGQLDDISIYSRSLSDLEVMQIYTQCVKHISLQPSDFSGTPGDPAMFSSFSNYDTAAVYQWQYNTGTGFVNLTPSAIYQGVDRNDLIVGSITTLMNNHQFRCIVSTPYACNDTSKTAKLSVQSVGLNQLLASSQITVFPNPTLGDFTIDYSKEKMAPQFISILNTLGMDVSDQIVISSNIPGKLDFKSNLPAGFYTILLSTENQVISRKIFISK